MWNVVIYRLSWQKEEEIIVTAYPWISQFPNHAQNKLRVLLVATIPSLRSGCAQDLERGKKARGEGRGKEFSPSPPLPSPSFFLPLVFFSLARPIWRLLQSLLDLYLLSPPNPHPPTPQKRKTAATQANNPWFQCFSLIVYPLSKNIGLFTFFTQSIMFTNRVGMPAETVRALFCASFNLDSCRIVAYWTYSVNTCMHILQKGISE